MAAIPRQARRHLTMLDPIADIEALVELQRALICHRNCLIEAARYPHGNTVANHKAAEKRLAKALWNAQDEIEELIADALARGQRP